MQKMIKSAILAVFVVGLTKLGLNYYMHSGENGGYGVRNETEIDGIDDNVLGRIELNSTENVRVRRKIIRQPSCQRSYMLVILEEICTDLVLKKEVCSPEDIFNKNKHTNSKRPRKKSPNNEPKVPALMNYVVGSLLITSLGAALIELYRAKKHAPKRSGKSPLSRKSSLADLTVMKHQRKELIRRESILEEPSDEGSHSGKQLLGCILPSPQRRCSSSVGVNVSGTMANTLQATPVVRQTSGEETRRTSVDDGRKRSLPDRRTSADYRMVLVEGKRLSVDDSPERRRYRHLVHRH